MKIFLNTKTIDFVELPDKVQIAKDIGYDGIEVWIEELDAYPNLNLAGFVVSVIGLKGWFEQDGSLMGVGNTFKEIYDECVRRMLLAKKIGAEFIVAVPSRSDRGFYRSLKEGRQNFERILEAANQIGIKIAFEFVGASKQVYDLATCIIFLNNIDCSIILDSYHFWRGDSNLELIPLVSQKIALLHINDANPNIAKLQHRDRDRLMPGDGIIDLQEFINKSKPFTNSISLGVYNPLFAEKGAYAVAKEGFDKIKTLLSVC